MIDCEEVNSRNVENMKTKEHRNKETWDHVNMRSREHRNVEKWEQENIKHGNKGTWKLRNMENMENMRTWEQGNKGIWESRNKGAYMNENVDGCARCCNV